MKANIALEGVQYEFDVNGAGDYQVGPYVVPIKEVHTFNDRDMVCISTGPSSAQWADFPDFGKFSVCSRSGTLYQPEHHPPARADPFGQYMADHHVCFNVAFWECLEQMIGKTDLWFRIDGHSYNCSAKAVCTDRPPRSTSSLRGYCGRTFKIRYLGTNDVLAIDDLWSNGTMPDWYKVNHPDNAEFAQ